MHIKILHHRSVHIIHVKLIHAECFLAELNIAVHKRESLMDCVDKIVIY